MFSLLLPDFTLILLGLLVCRFTALGRPVWVAVEQLVYFLLFPVLLFQSITRFSLDVSAASQLIAAGLTLGVVGIGMAWGLPYLPGLERHLDVRSHAAAAQVAFRFNSFIGLALAERLAGPQGLQWVSVLIGVCVPLFNVAAVWPMARHGGRGLVRELVRNPLIVATASGLMANLSGWHLPAWIEPTASRIGAAALALGLMSAGAGMQLGSLAQQRALAVGVLAVRHLLLPLTAFAIAWAMAMPPVQATVLLIFSALPTASSAYVLAARMGYPGGYVAALVTLSTLLGLLSLPLALDLARRL